jgi:hypothetical protein
MKAVLRHILRLKRDYANLPFFEHLRNRALSPEERLSFFPCMAPFILSFGDLNRYVLRVEPTDDPHQAMINAHTHEDDHHWPWYPRTSPSSATTSRVRPPTRCGGCGATRARRAACSRTASPI